MTLQELIDRALSVAMIGQDPSTTPALNADMFAEDLLPQVFGAVGERMAANERTRHLLRRNKTLVLVDGEIALPVDVLSAYITDSVLFDPADPSQPYSYLAWENFIRETLDTRLGHYSLQGESILHALGPGEAYDPNGGPDITLRLTIPCSPAVPAAAGDQLAVNAEIADELVTELARALRPLIPKFRQVGA